MASEETVFHEFVLPALKVARAKLNMLRNTFECTRKENVVKLNMYRQKRLEENGSEKRQDAQVHSRRVHSAKKASSQCALWQMCITLGSASGGRRAMCLCMCVVLLKMHVFAMKTASNNFCILRDTRRGGRDMHSAFFALPLVLLR